MERRMGEPNGHLLDSVQDRVQNVVDEFKNRRAAIMIDSRIFGRTEPCR
jgi:hypothetical protein